MVASEMSPGKRKFRVTPPLLASFLGYIHLPDTEKPILIPTTITRAVRACVCSVSTDRTVLHIATKPSRADWGGDVGQNTGGFIYGTGWGGGAGFGASIL